MTPMIRLLLAAPILACMAIVLLGLPTWTFLLGIPLALVASFVLVLERIRQGKTNGI